MKDPKERIVEGAARLFMRFGIRSVTMDDISRDLGMSKKTLYRHFRNKAEVVQAVSIAHFAQEKLICGEIHDVARDSVEEFLMIIRWMANSFKDISPGLLYDVQKYYPKAWEMFYEFKNGFVYEVVIDNLRKGIESGLYRKDMNVSMVAKLRVEMMSISLDQGVFPPDQFPPGDLMVEQAVLFLHGVVTMKGKKLIYKYLNQSEDE